MDIIDELCRRRDEVKKLWLERILNEYPPEAARSFARSKDAFANPAGVLIQQGSADFVDAVFDLEQMKAVPGQFDRLLQYRAIQEQKPSQALSFLPRLRWVCRQVAGSGDFSELDRRFDQAFLVAVDCYLAHRERLGEVRIAELKRMSQAMLRRFQGGGEPSFEEEGMP
ncbi:MAG: RsbRD N-terminal domain-containing protein [Acidobacteriota bacterium]|jgi:hypothetical protein